MLTLLPIDSIVPIILLATSISAVLTGAKIAYPIRALWCFTFGGVVFKPLRHLWPMVTCPYCNAWWTGGALAILAGLSWVVVAQVAFTTCGFVLVLQTFLGGSGIAADEDFEAIFDEGEE